MVFTGSDNLEDVKRIDLGIPGYQFDTMHPTADHESAIDYLNNERCIKDIKWQEQDGYLKYGEGIYRPFSMEHKITIKLWEVEIYKK